MPWLALFLGCLDHALTRAEETLANVTAKARIWEFVNRQPFNDRRLIINRLLNGFEGHLTTPKCAKIAKCSADYRDLKTSTVIITRDPDRDRAARKALNRGRL